MANKVTKKEVVRLVANQNNVSITVTQNIIDAFLESITSATTNGDEVAITGFGTFSLKHSLARTGRNPATGEQIKIPASSKLHFKPTKHAK